eukprot:9605244-Prorocentrum_lima.AAC.1
MHLLRVALGRTRLRPHPGLGPAAGLRVEPVGRGHAQLHQGPAQVRLLAHEAQHVEGTDAAVEVDAPGRQ